MLQRLKQTAELEKDLMETRATHDKDERLRLVRLFIGLWFECGIFFAHCLQFLQVSVTFKQTMAFCIYSLQHDESWIPT